MAKFKQLFQNIRHTSNFILKNAAKQTTSKPDDFVLEPPHTSPTPYQQIHASPTVECWNPIDITPLRVMNPDPTSSSALSLPSTASATPPPPPSRRAPSPPPSPPSHPASLHELFLDDDITPESFELQVTDEQEDNEPENPLHALPPRPASRLDMRTEDLQSRLSSLDRSFFPAAIAFSDSPFPHFARRQADSSTRRSQHQGPEIFPTLPLERRLTRAPRRVVELFDAERHGITATSLWDKPLPPLPIEAPTPTEPSIAEEEPIPAKEPTSTEDPLPVTENRIPRAETQMILQRTFAPAPEPPSELSDLERSLNDILTALDTHGEPLPALTAPTGILAYHAVRPPIWHAVLSPSLALSPQRLSTGHEIVLRSSWQPPPTTRSSSSAHSLVPSADDDYRAARRHSPRWQYRCPPFTYDGRTSSFDKDYFTHRHDRRRRFLEEDWEEWMERLILAKKLARRLSLALDNVGHFTIDF
ncbi:hypothetical protein MMC16_003105 [Acarospora aff. strigata]|nr:hypothetical protein [Acarospora aff. strigata]